MKTTFCSAAFAVLALATTATAAPQDAVPMPHSRACLSSVLDTAAEVVGIDATLLMKIAERESGMNPSARAGSSSASGLFQFTESTWLKVVERYGQRYGIGVEVGYVYPVAGETKIDENVRRRVLELRYDPMASALMAGELIRENTTILKKAFGRFPTNSELYVAHFLGPKGAVRLIQAAQDTVQTPAAEMFPKEAAANRSIFIRRGRLLTAAEVLARLSIGVREVANQVGCRP